MHKIVNGVRVDLTPEEIAEFEAAEATFAAGAHNAGIDRQIVAVESANPMTHRAQREGLYSIALLADLLNAAISQIEAEIRTIPGHETFQLTRLPDLKQNAGMVRIKTADDAIKILRAQRLT